MDPDGSPVTAGCGAVQTRVMSSVDTPATRLRWWAVAVFGLLVAALVAYIWTARGMAAVESGGDDLGLDVGHVVGATLTGALGLTLSWLRPRNPIGWLIAASGLLLALCDLGQMYGARALLLPGEHLPFGELALSLSAPLWIPALLLAGTTVLVRYPSGRLPRGWPRRFDRAVLVAFGLVYVGYATSAQSVTDEVPGRRPPLLLPEPVAGSLLLGGGLLLLAGLLAILGDALRRALRAGLRERAALLWLLVTALIAVLAVSFGPDPLGSLAYSAVLAAVAVGVLRYQALGIEVVVRRALIYAVLTGLVLAVFVGITAGLARLVPTGPTPQVVAAVLIAVGLSPARERVQRLVDRLLYGDRGDAAGALRRLGSSVGAAPAEGLLLAVLANLCEALRVDGAALLDDTGREVARWGAPATGLRLPLTFAGADLGMLVVGSGRASSRSPAPTGSCWTRSAR